MGRSSSPDQSQLHQIRHGPETLQLADDRGNRDVGITLEEMLGRVHLTLPLDSSTQDGLVHLKHKILGEFIVTLLFLVYTIKYCLSYSHF